MGGSITLPPGDYKLMAWTNFQVGDETRSGSEKLPPWKVNLRMLGGLLIAASLVGILVAVFVTLYVSFTDRPVVWLRWLWISLAVSFFAGCLPFSLFGNPSRPISSTSGKVPTALVELRGLE